MNQSSGESDGGQFGRRISIVQLQDKKLHYGCSVTRHAAFIKKEKKKGGVINTKDFWKHKLIVHGEFLGN